MAVQTQIQTRRGTAATWTSTNPTLAAGEIGFETDTNKFKIGTGSTAWTSLAYADIPQNTVTAKGDLLAASAANTVTNLAVGSDGSTLVANSASATGLAYALSPGFAAGKNKIINGDFGIWQRGTSFSITNNNAYTADRFQVDSGGSQTVTVTQQAFPLGSAPLAGYESQYFIRLAYGGNNTTTLARQYIEDVRTFAGQTATLSFFAKVSSGTKTILPRFVQNFGTGGSSVVVTYASAVTLTTFWQRFAVTVSIPSISGKSIGAGSNLHIDFYFTADSLAYDLWGVQAEAGSVATPFQTATGTIQGELAACQRYYYVAALGNNYAVGTGANYSATNAYFTVAFPVTMRINTAALVSSTGTDYYAFDRNGAADTFNSLNLAYIGPNVAILYNLSEISGTAGQAGTFRTNNASASIALSAEL